jgi:hypothetical protein
VGWRAAGRACRIKELAGERPGSTVGDRLADIRSILAGEYKLDGHVMEYPKLESWWHLPFWAASEMYFYLLFVGVATTGLVALVWLCAFILSKVGVLPAIRAARYSTLLLFAAYLCGAPANLLFIAVFRYHAYIPGDPLVDWLPFVPTGAWVVDPNFNGRFINGGSPESLRVAWAALAVPVWATALWLTGRFAGRWPITPAGPSGAV